MLICPKNPLNKGFSEEKGVGTHKWGRFFFVRARGHLFPVRGPPSENTQALLTTSSLGRVMTFRRWYQMRDEPPICLCVWLLMM